MTIFLLLLQAVTVVTGGAMIQIPTTGPAFGDGRPCQIFTGAGEAERPADYPELRAWMPRFDYRWAEAEEFDDGTYVGLLEVVDGKVIPCSEGVDDDDDPRD